MEQQRMRHMDLRCAFSKLNDDPLGNVLASCDFLDKVVDDRAGNRDHGRGRREDKETSRARPLIERPVVDFQTRIGAGFDVCPGYRAMQRNENIAKRDTLAAGCPGASHCPTVLLYLEFVLRDERNSLLHIAGRVRYANGGDRPIGKVDAAGIVPDAGYDMTAFGRGSLHLAPYADAQIGHDSVPGASEHLRLCRGLEHAHDPAVHGQLRNNEGCGAAPPAQLSRYAPE